MAEKQLQDVPLWLVRFGVTVAFIPCLIWVAVTALMKELRPVPKYVWWTCSELVGGMKFMWKTGRPPEEREW